MNGISEDYRELTPREVEAFDAFASRAWQDDAMPWRQYLRVVKGELETWRNGGDVLPYKVAHEVMKALPIDNPKLLDVGASSGYYSEVLNSRGYACQYTGIDFSEAYKRMATALFPGIKFDVGDARNLPYADRSFDVVLHSACLMHIREYPKAIWEAARVAKRFVVFHRTPIQAKKPTTFYAKEAYSQICLEVMINAYELVGIFKDSGLKVLKTIDLFMNEDGSGQMTYVCEASK